LAAMVCVVLCIVMVGVPVFAITPQENPDTAKTEFSGLSLFQLYSGTLDLVLIKNQQDLQANIEKYPFANIPPAMTDSFNNFISSADSLCNLMLGLDAGISETKLLMQESRFNEAGLVNDKAINDLTSAQTDLVDIQQAANIAGDEFQATTGNNSLNTSYLVILDRIQKLKDVLALYRSMLKETQSEIQNNAVLPSSDITLNINPPEAFVGDTINVEGTLSIKGNPLDNRQIAILLNGSQYLTTTTDAQGHYFSSLLVPSWYISVLQIQALYYPQDADVGVYELALSSPVTLKVLFYTAVLTLTPANAYSGRETSIVGQFDYGLYPIENTRTIEISLDNNPIKESNVTSTFTEKLSLPDGMGVGNHLITISAPASGRYAPVVSSAPLIILKAISVNLTTNLSSITFIPGSFHVRGKLDSEIGPAAQAGITMIFEGRRVDALSGEDGTFSATIKNNMGFGLFGSQLLEFKIMPVEPWQTTLTVSHKIMTVYILNCGVFLLILVLLGIILPRRLIFRNLFANRKKIPQPVSIAKKALPQPSTTPTTDNPTVENENSSQSAPDTRLFYWYRIVIQLIQRASGVLLKPNQTLREYINDTGNSIGAAGKPILEFTRMIEKVLYSTHHATADDIKNGEQLARKVQESIRK
jgi:hypothetical protein